RPGAAGHGATRAATTADRQIATAATDHVAAQPDTVISCQSPLPRNGDEVIPGPPTNVPDPPPNPHSAWQGIDRACGRTSACRRVSHDGRIAGITRWETDHADRDRSR